MDQEYYCLRVYPVDRLSESSFWSVYAGRYIAIDQGSGGYPYAVDSLMRAETWPATPEGMEKAIAYRRDEPFEVVLLTCTTTLICR